MRMVGVSELEDHITEVLQSVQETGETVAVTKDGEIIAHLVPAAIPRCLAKVPDGDIWANFDRLVTELGVQWPEGVNAVDAVRDVRREL